MNPIDWRVKCTKKIPQPPRRRKDAHALFSVLNDLHELRSQSIIPRYPDCRLSHASLYGHILKITFNTFKDGLSMPPTT